MPMECVSSSSVCTDMGNFWANLNDACPLPVLWRVMCASEAADAELCDVASHHGQPTVFERTHGSPWQLYRGARSLQGLASHVASRVSAMASNAASGVGEASPSQPLDS